MSSCTVSFTYIRNWIPCKKNFPKHVVSNERKKEGEPMEETTRGFKLEKGGRRTYGGNHQGTRRMILRNMTIQYIARFFYRNVTPFNVTPSYHELRLPLLKKELEYTKDLLKGHEEEQMKYGYSIMSNC
ncbi:hypothetical protein CR513_17707, partial [Mucuna pruriens]